MERVWAAIMFHLLLLAKHTSLWGGKENGEHGSCVYI